MVTLNYHLEHVNDEQFEDMLRNAHEKGPIEVSPSPWQDERWGKYVEELKGLFLREKLFLGQQGLNHRCDKCVSYQKIKGERDFGIDRWHENYCLWCGEIPLEKQIKLIEEGREKLADFFGVNALGYHPPNHLYDRNTLIACRRLGYNVVSDRALIPVRPYESKGIIVVPEGEPNIRGINHFYIHADRWEGDLDEAIKGGLTSYREIMPVEEDAKIIEINRGMKLMRKFGRDFVNCFKDSPVRSVPLFTKLAYELVKNKGEPL